MKGLKMEASGVFRSSARLRALMLLAMLFMFAPSAQPVHAQNVSLSIQQWSFIADTAGERISGPGQHVSIGLIGGLTPRLELDFSAVTMLTPKPGDSLLGAVSLGYSLLAERWINDRVPPNWVSMLAEIGFLGGGTELWARGFSGATPKAQVFVRFTPLVLGNSFYRRRDRLLALGFAYDLLKLRGSFFFNFFAIDASLRR